MAPLWLSVKYANMLTGRLTLYKVKKTSPYTATFRCLYCNDSQQSKLKTRGYLYVNKKGTGLRFKCHNCGMGLPFDKFLDTVDSHLYNEYKLECLKEAGSEATTPKAQLPPDIGQFPKKRFENNPLKGLKKISQLRPDHPAKLYIEHRQLPPNSHHKLYYCPKFFAWVNTVKPETFEESKIGKDEPRLIIPFRDETGQVFGFQGRSFRKEGLRYITIMLDESKTKIFGLDTVDLSKTTYVVEGPLDSLFIDNCLGAAGSDLIVRNAANLVYVLDNEPRNKEIVKKLDGYIDQGYTVVIWPTAPIAKQDINDLIMAGMSREQLHEILRKNTCSGLTARMRFHEWRKI